MIIKDRNPSTNIEVDRPRTSEDSSEAVGADVIDAGAVAASTAATGAGSSAGDSASVSIESGTFAHVTGA